MIEYNFNEGFKLIKSTWKGNGDRVPVFAQLHEFAMKWNRISGKKFYRNAEIYVKGILDVVKEFELDIPDIVWDAYNLEAEALGVKVFFHDNQSPALDQSQPLIETETDLAKLKSPNPSISARLPWAMECIKIYKELTGITSPLTFCAPFSLATLLMGYEKLVMAIYSNPNFVKKILNFLTEEVIAPYINAAFKEFNDCPTADGSDALSSLPFLTHEMLEEFSVPYILRLRELCGDRVVVRNWWGDSYAKDLEKFWDLKLKISPGILEVQDPDLFKIGPGRIIEYSKKKDLAVIFGVDQTLLSEGSPQEIDERIKDYISIGGQNKKLVLYFCNLNSNTPEDNIRAAMEAIKKYGRYNTDI